MLLAVDAQNLIDQFGESRRLLHGLVEPGLLNGSMTRFVCFFSGQKGVLACKYLILMGLSDLGDVYV